MWDHISLARNQIGCAPPALGTQSLSHWTVGEVPEVSVYNKSLYHQSLLYHKQKHSADLLSSF